MKKCLVCRIPIDDLPRAVSMKRGDDLWEFCSDACASAFLAEPTKYESLMEEAEDEAE